MYVYERDQYAESHRVGPGWGLWCAWVLATSLGGILGRALGSIIEILLPQAGALYFVGLVLSGSVAGLILGFSQGMVLLRYLQEEGMVQWVIATIIGRSGRWILTSTIGAVIVGSLQIVDGPGYYTETPPWNPDPYLSMSNVVLWLLALALIWGVSGGVLGLAQWFVLRRQTLHANWWILANAGGAALGMVLAGATFLNDPGNESLIFIIVVEVVYAAITGIALVDLLRHPRLEASWQLAMRPEPVLEPTEDTMLGSLLYARGPAVPDSGQSINDNTQQGEPKT